MTNAEIAGIFEEIGNILRLRGDENPFRVRAYDRAANSIGAMSKSLGKVYEEGGIDGLKELPGIGDDLASKIEELLTTGELQYLQKIREDIPPGVFAMLDIEGLGPKRVQQLWKKVGITSIEELKEAIENEKLEGLSGWGKKLEESVIRAIGQHGRMAGRIPLYQAQTLANEIVKALEDEGMCSKLEIAGSLRRGKETVGDLDILAATDKPEGLMNIFCALPQVESVKAKGPTKSTVFLHSGIDCDLRVVEEDIFGAALHYFTGSKDHNVAIRRRGIERGVTISEYGVHEGKAADKGKLLASKTEEDVYKAVGLPFIHPHLREDRGEFAAAEANKLPRLIEGDDIIADLHMHSTISDGKASIADMARAAKKKGYEHIAITDHASSMGMVLGIKNTEESMHAYLEEVEKARAEVPGIHILAGAEVDIQPNGTLYLADELLAQLNWVVASVHHQFRQSSAETTKRLIKAVSHPSVCVLGHPTARLVAKREGIQADWEAVFEAAKEHSCALEIDAAAQRMDLNDTMAMQAREMGISLCIDSDAHSIEGIDPTYGIIQARRAWCEAHDIVNTWGWATFEKWRKKKNVSA